MDLPKYPNNNNKVSAQCGPCWVGYRAARCPVPELGIIHKVLAKSLLSIHNVYLIHNEWYTLCINYTYCIVYIMYKLYILYSIHNV